MSDSTRILSFACVHTSSLEKESNTCHPPGVTKGFIKGEALRLLRKNSSEITFEENMRNFSTRLKNRDYAATTVSRKTSLRGHFRRQKESTRSEIALPNLKNILMGKWHLIQNQPYLRNIFKEPSLISYRKGKSLKDVPARQHF